MTERAWTPPTDGTPCWVEIPAIDLARAGRFYSTVFNWTIKSGTTAAGDFTGFSFPDEKFRNLTGGFRQVKGTHAPDVPKLYLYVSDLEKTMASIVANGGKKVSDVEPESDFGLMMHAEDTEGNPVGIYTMKNKAS